MRALDKVPHSVWAASCIAERNSAGQQQQRGNANPRDDICPPSSLLLLIFGEQTQWRDYVFFILAVNLKFICLRRKRVGVCVCMHHVCYAHGETNNKSGGIYAPPFSFIANNALCFPAIDFRPRALAFMCVRVCALLFTCLSGGDANPQVEPQNTQTHSLSQQWGVAGFVFN